MFCLICFYFRKTVGVGANVGTWVCFYFRGLIVDFPLNQSATVFRGFLSFFVNPNQIANIRCFALFFSDLTASAPKYGIKGSISVSGKLRTYPSPNPTVTLTYLLIMTCWVRGGVGAQFPRNWYWSGLSHGDTKLPDYGTLFLIIWETSIPIAVLNVDSRSSTL